MAAASGIPPLGSTCRFETQVATRVLKITNYSLSDQMKHDSRNSLSNCVESSKFAVGGLQWCIRYFPAAASSIGCVAVYAYADGACSASVGTRALSASVEFALLDQRDDPPTPKFVRTTESRPGVAAGSCFGFRDYILQPDLAKSGLIKDDCILVRCTVTLLVSVTSDGLDEMPQPLFAAEAAPAPDMGQQFTALLESKEGADITFRVGDRDFPAHRLILAARSAVFRAQLLGGMKESEVQHVEVKGVDPDVFDSLLRFVYSDALPSIDQEPVPMVQRLLVAADKYGVEKMKLLCVERLSKSIDIDTAATTLALAIQHHCGELKKFCVEFITSNNRMGMVMATEGFKHLDESCPWIMKELLQKLSKAR